MITKQGTVYKFQQLEVYQLALEKVVRFMVQLEVLLQGEWKPVIRYA